MKNDQTGVYEPICGNAHRLLQISVPQHYHYQVVAEFKMDVVLSKPVTSITTGWRDRS